MILDTNILIYLAQPGGESLQELISSTSPAASLISRVESLGFHRITADPPGVAEEGGFTESVQAGRVRP